MRKAFDFMARKGSKKSSKKPKPADPIEEIEPVEDIADIPVALINIREMVSRLEEKRVIEREKPLDEITGSDLEYVEIAGKIKTLVDSCISAIKANGLQEMGLDNLDASLIAFGLGMYAGEQNKNGHPLSPEDHQRVGYIMQGLESLRFQPEVIATVNPLPDNQSSGVEAEG